MDELQQLVRPPMKKMRKLAKHNSVGGLFMSEDIMTEIFLWLPLKSLIRFKRLSKRWYFLISDKDNNNNSYNNFRRNYLSTFSSSSSSSSSSRRRRRNRIIVGRSGDDNDSTAIMAGFFFYLKPPEFWESNVNKEPVGFLPCTSTQFKKYFFLPPELATTITTSAQLILLVKRRQRYILGRKSLSIFPEPEPHGDESASTTPMEIINKINPFLSLNEPLDNFLSARLHEDEQYYPSLVVVQRHIFVAASSNGFLFCTLNSGFSHTTNYLFNPVTMEWLALPQLPAVDADVYLGFVCKGDYPSLDLVEYTVVRLFRLDEEGATLRFQLLCSSTTGGTHHEWIEYRVSCESLQVEFDLRGQRDTVIVSTTTTATNTQLGGGSGSRILVYFLAMLRITKVIAIVAIDLNVGDESLKIFETPGPDRGDTVYYCEDYIREFDGVIHYVRFCCSKDFEFWVLNTESGEWYLKHTASLKMMLSKVCSSMHVYRWTEVNTCARYHIHAFHPMNPSLIFLTLYGKFSCYNFETGMLEVVYDYDAQNIKSDYIHFVYQWPCWPPLL